MYTYIQWFKFQYQNCSLGWYVFMVFPVWKIFHQQPGEVDTITPGMQNDMRTSKRSTMKKGRKAKVTGKKGKGTKSKITRKNSSKLDILSSKSSKKAKKNKAISEEADHSAQEQAQGSTRPKPVAKAKAKAKATAKVSRAKVPRTSDQGSNEPDIAKVNQTRVGDGKNWRYEVLPDQIYGCTNCRFIYGGCRNCKKDTFRGKTAHDIREETGEGQQPEVQKAPKKRPKKVKAQATAEGLEGAAEAADEGDVSQPKARRRRRTNK